MINDYSYHAALVICTQNILILFTSTCLPSLSISSISWSTCYLYYNFEVKIFPKSLHLSICLGLTRLLEMMFFLGSQHWMYSVMLWGEDMLDREDRTQGPRNPHPHQMVFIVENINLTKDCERCTWRQWLTESAADCMKEKNCLTSKRNGSIYILRQEMRRGDHP